MFELGIGDREQLTFERLGIARPWPAGDERIGGFDGAPDSAGLCRPAFERQGERELAEIPGQTDPVAELQSEVDGFAKEVLRIGGAHGPVVSFSGGAAVCVPLSASRCLRRY